MATGSHIDTQPSGGKFVGNFGVLAGLEVMRTLDDLGIVTRAPLEVAFWTNEEGTRFTPVMMGSGVFAGEFDAAFARAQADVDDVSVGDALAAIGYRGAQPAGEVPGGMFGPTSRRISSRGRCSKRPGCRSAWSRARWGSSGTT